MGRGRVERERVGGGAKQRVGFNGKVKKSHRGRWGSLTLEDEGVEVRQREEKRWDEREIEQLGYNYIVKIKIK